MVANSVYMVTFWFAGFDNLFKKTNVVIINSQLQSKHDILNGSHVQDKSQSEPLLFSAIHVCYL